MRKASIVIPLYNNWELTEACLGSLARNTDPGSIEVIAVDNACSDVTPHACPQLGRKLFGDFFRYIRNEINRNFAGASNQGAQASCAEYIVFLNNDTEVQAGWLEPLLADFTAYPGIAATGPVLAYPEMSQVGLTVQHLGVVFNPWLRVSHLYKGVPLSSPLARKRRFFQAITAACMVIPKSLFTGIGGFDEGFINGFEDVDLCARLWKKGYRFTVNPESLVLHCESRSEGRNAHDSRNSQKLENGNLQNFVPDWHLKIREDGLVPQITNFGIPRAVYPASLAGDLDSRLERMRPEILLNSIRRYPLWEKGWQGLLAQTRDLEKRQTLFEVFQQIFPTPENDLSGCMLAMRRNDPAALGKYLSALKNSIDSPESILCKVKDNRDWCADLGLDDLKKAYDSWLGNYENFRDRFFPAFATECVKLAGRIGYPLSPADAGLYNLWLKRMKAPCPLPDPDPEIGFSLLMPVYNPEPGFFRKALDSVLAQTWPHWELCIADDASTDKETGKIIREYAKKDPRIKPFFRNKNGHIAAATNSALKLASLPWTVFMDDDDFLAPEALSAIAAAIRENPEGLLFYSDEDKITEYDHHNRPHLKNGWDPELLLHQNFVCHLTVMDTERLREIGGLKQGFSGAQDHELILRYSEALPETAFVHVPEILYGWREHDSSTARSLDTKDYALDSAVRAAQSHLDRVEPGSVVTRMTDDLWTRVRYPLPDDRPLVSLIMPKAPFAGYQEFLKIRTRYPFEIVNSPAEAKGEILAFLDRALLPVSQGWLEELVSCLWRTNIGAVGGSVVGSDGRQIHAGYLADSSGRLKPIFQGAIREPYIGWLSLPRTVKALDGLCLLTRKIDFDCHPCDGAWDFQDYCLRLEERGKRTVWWPFAKFVASSSISLPDAPMEFHERWKLQPFNRNLKIVDQGFALETGNVSAH
ncbi:MAG: glycosyltransferase [Desulfovibrio sp.]|nr:glycosyltransferase [Desulfovibrio sp.]